MRRLITSILTILTITGMHAQALPQAPRLVIGLTIDQLRTDYLEAFSALYGERGFKRLWREARIYRNAEYPFAGADRASAIASIYTGTSPSVNGIVSGNWLDANTLRPVNCVDDPSFMGYYGGESTSPTKLLASTIADELKVATRGKALVYSLAPFREAAIFGAGHSGDGAFWINDFSGKWSGSTYYKEFPRWVADYNDGRALDFRIGSITWGPLLPTTNYTHLTAEPGKNTFRHKFDEARRNKFKRFIVSPFANDEVNDLTELFLHSSMLGKDNIVDLLSLTYYAGPYNREESQESALEMQDIYVRLDRSLARLLDIIDQRIGMQNVVLFITSTGYTAPEGTDQNDYRIPGGEFYLNRCAALLNMYLMASYGEGQYVEAYYNQQIYLNHKLIEQKQLSLTDVQAKAAEFLMQFSGVDEVYSSNRLLHGAWTPDIHKIRNAFHRKRSGDLVIDVLPGWTVMHENPWDNYVVRKGHIPAPLIFMGSSIKPAIIHTPVSTNHIAPTLAYCMRIRAPNASTAIPLTGIR